MNRLIIIFELDFFLLVDILLFLHEFSVFIYLFLFAVFY